ncbi:MAG: hypothetical protein Q9175_008051 [Cornicularia normoerica]
MESPSGPPFGKTKHELPEDQEAQLDDAFPNSRYYYSRLGFLQKWKGGRGRGGKWTGGSSVAFSPPSRGTSGSSSSGSSSWSWSKPSAPKSGPGTGGSSSPSKPKSPISSPPKAPELPKPNPGWKPPAGSLPGYTPGRPPHHGSGGHVPVIGGGHDHNHDSASPAPRTCINPKGMDRLRCKNPDAVVATLFAITALLLVLFLIYLRIKSCLGKRAARRNSRHEEDGMELTRAQSSRLTAPDGSSNIARLAASPSPETITTLTKKHTRNQSIDPNSPLGQPPPAYQPSTRSVSRGRKLSQHEHSSIKRASRSLSSGTTRTAKLGQNPVINNKHAASSSGSSRGVAERRRSSSRYDIDRPAGCDARGGGERRGAEEGGRGGGCMVDGDEASDGDAHSETERGERDGKHRRSSSRASERMGNEEVCCVKESAGSRRSTSERGASGQPDELVDTPTMDV